MEDKEKIRNWLKVRKIVKKEDDKNGISLRKSERGRLGFI